MHRLHRTATGIDTRLLEGNGVNRAPPSDVALDSPKIARVSSRVPFSNATGSRHAAAGDVRRVAVGNGQNVAHSRERAAWRAVIRISLSVRIQLHTPYPRRVRLSVFCLARMNVNPGTVSRSIEDRDVARLVVSTEKRIIIRNGRDVFLGRYDRTDGNSYKLVYTDAFLGRTIDANLRELVI